MKGGDGEVHVGNSDSDGDSDGDGGSDGDGDSEGDLTTAFFFFLFFCFLSPFFPSASLGGSWSLVMMPLVALVFDVVFGLSVICSFFKMKPNASRPTCLCFSRTGRTE